LTGKKSYENGPKKEQFSKKPTNICGNGRFVVDKELRKVEGEHRRGSPHPREHWRLRFVKFPAELQEDANETPSEAGCGDGLRPMLNPLNLFL
jgi:hypothetical protein